MQFAGNGGTKIVLELTRRIFHRPDRRREGPLVAKLEATELAEHEALAELLLTSTLQNVTRSRRQMQEQAGAQLDAHSKTRSRLAKAMLPKAMLPVAKDEPNKHWTWSKIAAESLGCIAKRAAHALHALASEPTAPAKMLPKALDPCSGLLFKEPGQSDQFVAWLQALCEDIIRKSISIDNVVQIMMTAKAGLSSSRKKAPYASRE